MAIMNVTRNVKNQFSDDKNLAMRINFYKKYTTNKYNSNLEITKQITNSNRVKEVLKIANNCCELCNKKSEKLDIYVIDKSKPSEDLDSILNIIAVCPTCKSKIYKNKEKYTEAIKKIVDDRLNKIV